jgi:hypothetical protein
MDSQKDSDAAGEADLEAAVETGLDVAGEAGIDADEGAGLDVALEADLDADDESAKKPEADIGCVSPSVDVEAFCA